MGIDSELIREVLHGVCRKTQPLHAKLTQAVPRHTKVTPLTIEENTFAAACFDQNTIAELEDALSGRADVNDMKQWELTEIEWRGQIALALEAKRSE